jgi:hypothetical protein
MLPLLQGCGGGSEGYARLVNATSDHSSLDLYQSSSKVSSAIASYAVSDYAGLSPGTYTYNLKDSNASAVLATTSGTVAKDDRHTIVAYTTGGALNTQVLTDNEGDPDSGYAKLRVFHTASTEAGSVDVYVVSTACTSLGTSSAQVFASSLNGLQPGYTQVSATSGGTSYHLCVTGAGDKSDLRLDIPALSLSEKQITTLILTRSAGGVLLHGLLLNQQGSLKTALNASARLRLAVGASSAAAVTASANGTTLGTNLTAPAVTGYKLVSAGALTLNVTVGGTAANASGLTADPGADLTLLVAGTAATAPALIADDNTVSTSSTKPTKLRLVNGMTGSGSTAYLNVDYNDIGNGSGAAYGAASSYSNVAASAALARLEASYGNSQLCLSTGVTLNSGSVYTVFLLGDIPLSTSTCTLRVDR